MQSALHPGEEGRLLKDLKWEANWKSRMISLKSTCTFLSAALPVIWTHFLAQKGSPFQSCQQLGVPRWKLKIAACGCSPAPHGVAGLAHQTGQGKSPFLFPLEGSFHWDWKRKYPGLLPLSKVGILGKYKSDMYPTSPCYGLLVSPKSMFSFLRSL